MLTAPNKQLSGWRDAPLKLVCYPQNHTGKEESQEGEAQEQLEEGQEEEGREEGKEDEREGQLLFCFFF